MDVERHSSPVKLPVQRFKLGIGKRAAQDRGRHRDPHHVKLVKCALYLSERRVDMGQRSGGEGGETRGIAPHQVRIQVVDCPGRLYRVGPIFKVGQLWRC